MKILGFIPVLFVGIWSFVFWWQHPTMTEMQVFQSFGNAWLYATVIAMAIWLQPIVSWLRSAK